MFKNAKVGDAVWDLRYGWGKVRSICSSEIGVIFPVDTVVEFIYFINGNARKDDLTPMLYWSEVKIEAPKRKVKKEVWVNLYLGMGEKLSGYLGDAHIYDSEASADRAATRYRLGGKAHRIEIEVEE